MQLIVRVKLKQYGVMALLISARRKLIKFWRSGVRPTSDRLSRDKTKIATHDRYRVTMTHNITNLTTENETHTRYRCKKTQPITQFNAMM